MINFKKDLTNTQTYIIIISELRKGEMKNVNKNYGKSFNNNCNNIIYNCFGK